MPTTFFSLPPELRFQVYRYYETAYNYSAHKATVIGDRLLLPPLLYASGDADREIGQKMFDKLEKQLFRAKTIRAVVVNLDFDFLLHYFESLDEKAPLISGGGTLELVLVFTEACLTMHKEAARRRKLSLWAFLDFLGALGCYYEKRRRDFRIHRSFRFDPPELEKDFGSSPLLDAMGGCRLERSDFAVIRVAKAMTAVKRMVRSGS